jgi:hypothetical protein
LADLDHDAVKVNDWIDSVQRTILPLNHLVDNSVGDLGYEPGRDLGAVHFLEGVLPRKPPNVTQYSYKPELEKLSGTICQLYPKPFYAKVIVL